MVFWVLAIAVTAVACAALYYAAAGRTVNAATGTVDDATTAHFRLQLKEIETDIAAGRMGSAEGIAAKGEMARELIRLKGEGQGTSEGGRQRAVVLIAIAATAIVAFGTYALLGQPDLPSAPLAERPERQMTLEAAITRIEEQLTRTPDDLRGWVAIAPAYMQLGRFVQAERAYRRIIALGEPTAEAETNLAEAIMMRQGGSIAGEPLDLLQSAVARDAGNVRARFYLAGEATRAGAYESAIAQWNELIALATGEEPWLATARDGLMPRAYCKCGRSNRCGRAGGEARCHRRLAEGARNQRAVADRSLREERHAQSGCGRRQSCGARSARRRYSIRASQGADGGRRRGAQGCRRFPRGGEQAAEPR